MVLLCPSLLTAGRWLLSTEVLAGCAPPDAGKIAKMGTLPIAAFSARRPRKPAERFTPLDTSKRQSSLPIDRIRASRDNQTYDELDYHMKGTR